MCRRRRSQHMFQRSSRCAKLLHLLSYRHRNRKKHLALMRPFKTFSVRLTRSKSVVVISPGLKLRCSFSRTPSNSSSSWCKARDRVPRLQTWALLEDFRPGSLTKEASPKKWLPTSLTCAVTTSQCRRRDRMSLTQRSSKSSSK